MSASFATAVREESPAGLVRAALAGDELAFATIVERHRVSMTRVAFVVCGDADLAEADHSLTAGSGRPAARPPRRSAAPAAPWLDAPPTTVAGGMRAPPHRRLRSPPQTPPGELGAILRSGGTCLDPGPNRAYHQ